MAENMALSTKFQSNPPNLKADDEIYKVLKQSNNITLKFLKIWTPEKLQ